MALVAEFEIRSPDLTLAHTYDAVPEAEFDLVTEVATDPEHPVLFFWAEAPDFGAFEAALEDDPTVREVTRYAEADGRRLYRTRTTDEVDVVLYPLWVELGADLLHVRFADGWWHFRVRVPDRDVLSEIRGWFREVDVEFDLHSVLDATTEGTTPLLTPAQAETLQLAHRWGYFSVPRETSLAALAEEFDVSQQAVSERLRRGLDRVLAHRFGTAADGGRSR